MDATRNDARRRGLRMAAQVAALTGLIGASAGASRADEQKPAMMSQGAGQEAESEGAVFADRVAEAIRVRSHSGNCGCGGCWGPSAPPAMPASGVEDLEVFASTTEVA
jgi:hypothetical protein